MLDAFIIEELRRQERKEKSDERPVLRLPLDDRDPGSHEDEDEGTEREPKGERGVHIIDL